MRKKKLDIDKKNSHFLVVKIFFQSVRIVRVVRTHVRIVRTHDRACRAYARAYVRTHDRAYARAYVRTHALLSD